MKPIKIFCDSCSDITEDIRKQYDIVSIDFTIYLNGKEIDADPWKKVSPHTLYNTLRSGERVYTLPATEHEIRQKFTKYVDEFDIIYVAACEKQSTTIKKARRIAEKIMNEDSTKRIEIIDSLNASIGQMIVTLEACKLRDKGLPIEEIVSEVKAMRNNVLEFVTVDTLTYLSRANKIDARSAMLGDLIKIKPILVSDADGNQVAMSKIKGRKNSIEEIIRLFLDNVVDPESQEIYIVHGDEEATALNVKNDLVMKGFTCKKINVFNVGPVVGITVGPGMVGIFGVGKEVTFRGE